MKLAVLWIIFTGLLYKAEVIEGRGRIIHGKFFGTVLNNTNLPFRTKVTKDYPIYWINQPLDHDNPEDTRTWNQMYFKNESFYKPGGPICINIEGEAPADPYWVMKGEMVDHCSRLNAMIYSLEHRFYGKSQPLPDASVASLKYLTIPQALADLNRFILEVKSIAGQECSKVILYGGSYPGTLAAYFAQKYPEVAYISVASSAPIAWKYDYKEYMEVVGRVIKSTSSQCYRTVEFGMKHMNQIISSTSCSPEKTRCSANMENLKLCKPLDPQNSKDVQTMNEAVMGVFSYYVQYNGIIPTGIKAICDYLTDRANGKTDFERLANLVNMLYLTLETDCLDFSDEEYCAYLAAESWNDESVSSGARMWTWQVCNEVGAFQTTSSSHQPFGNLVPPSYFARQCRCAFGEEYTDSFIEANINRHMEAFGGRSELREKTIFINGENDPWSPMGVTNMYQLANPRSNPVTLIQGASHCNDMSRSRVGDSIFLIQARLKNFEYVSSMLGRGDSSCSNKHT